MVYFIGAHFSENPHSSIQHSRSHQRADRNPSAELKINLPKAKTVFETGYEPIHGDRITYTVAGAIVDAVHQ